MEIVLTMVGVFGLLVAGVVAFLRGAQSEGRRQRQLRETPDQYWSPLDPETQTHLRLLAERGRRRGAATDGSMYHAPASRSQWEGDDDVA